MLREHKCKGFCLLLMQEDTMCNGVKTVKDQNSNSKYSSLTKMNTIHRKKVQTATKDNIKSFVVLLGVQCGQGAHH